MSGLYSEEFQGAVLVQTCSKILDLNSLTSNSPWTLDAKHKKAFCDRWQNAKDWKAPVVMWGFLELVRELLSPTKMYSSEFLKHRRQGHSKCSSQWSYIHTSLYSTLQSFPPRKISKSLFDRRYALPPQIVPAIGEFAGLGQVTIIFFLAANRY